MLIFTIAYYTIKQSLRDYGLLLKMLLLPLVAIFILGQALNTVFIVSEIQPTGVAVYWQDTEEDNLLAAYLHDVAMQGIVDVIPAESVNAGKSLVERGGVHSFLYIDSSDLYIYGDGNNSFRTSIVEYVAATFSLVPQINSVDNLYLAETFIPLGDLPRAIDYYGVTMLVMILFFGSVYGSSIVSKDYLGSVDQRRRAISIPSWQWYGGKALGSVGIVFTQGVLIIGFTAMVYEVNWGDHLWLLGFITLLFTILSVGFGMLTAMVLRDGALASRTLNLLVPISTFIAGGYVILNRPGQVLQVLQYMSPNYWIQTAFFNTIYGEAVQETIMIIWGLLSLILLLFCTIAVVGKKGYR